MEKSGKPESSWGGDDDPKPGPIYHPSNLLDGNYCSGQKGMMSLSTEEEYCMLMMNEVDSSSCFQGGPDHGLDPTRFAASTSSGLQQDRNARKRENDRKYRERNKMKEQEMRSKLCRVEQENLEVMRENESLKGKLVCVNESLQSQATDIQHLRQETELWNLEHAKQMALVHTLSDQSLLASASARSENQILVEQNRRLRLSIAGDDDDETLLKLAEDTANLKLENALLKLNNDALAAKMVHHHNTDLPTQQKY